MVIALRTKVDVISMSIFSQMIIIILSVPHLDNIFFMQLCEMLSNLTA